MLTRNQAHFTNIFHHLLEEAVDLLQLVVGEGVVDLLGETVGNLLELGLKGHSARVEAGSANGTELGTEVGWSWSWK